MSALDSVDLNIEDGEFFCILGGNGSGKSTFAKHLNALLQPDAGTVRINGMDASDPELVYDIRSTAGMVFRIPMISWWQRLSKMTLRSVPKTLACHRRKLRSAYARR
ncbi:MAG: ATP-binding cassette domain-containing protein [Collinsella aerofaciens]